jgi:hypothetical protein
VIQDHGVGGNYSRFGGDGFFYQTALAVNSFPHSLVIADNSRPWPGFTPVPKVDSAQNRIQRTLYFKNEMSKINIDEIEKK